MYILSIGYWDGVAHVIFGMRYRIMAYDNGVWMLALALWVYNTDLEVWRLSSLIAALAHFDIVFGYYFDFELMLSFTCMI